MKMFKDKFIRKAEAAYQTKGVADPRAGETVYTNDIGAPKDKKLRESHTARTKYGMGDYYGTGPKAKIGKVRDDTVGYRPVSKKQLGTPPKSVV